jgi:hypothetical protein
LNKLDNPTAADDLVVLVEDCRLSGCDGSLRLVEDGADEVVAFSDEGCGSGRVTMANLGGDAKLFAFREARD